MNKNSNTYIIAYAAVMVVIVAAVLSFAALSLKGVQAENARVEKMGDILRSIGEGGDADLVKDKAAYINEQYKKYIVDSYAVKVEGDRVEGANAFALLTNLKAEYDKPAAERSLPVFVSRNDEGVTSYVIPVWGAEISTAAFQAQFKGKHILENGRVVAIRLVKGGAPDDDPYAVDAVSGGTLTSVGVEKMLKNCLSDYDAYIEKQLGETAGNEVSTKNSESHE